MAIQTGRYVDYSLEGGLHDSNMLYNGLVEVLSVQFGIETIVDEMKLSIWLDIETHYYQYPMTWVFVCFRFI